jgi:hypothetical protein
VYNSPSVPYFSLRHFLTALHLTCYNQLFHQLYNVKLYERMDVVVLLARQLFAVTVESLRVPVT